MSCDISIRSKGSCIIDRLKSIVHLNFIQRFSLTIIFAVFSTIYWILLNYEFLTGDRAIFSTLFLGTFIFFATALLTEQPYFSIRFRIPAYMAGALLTLLLYPLFSGSKESSFPILFAAMFWAIVAPVPLLPPWKSDDRRNAIFLITLLQNLGIAMVAGLILFLGLVAAIGTVKVLFKPAWNVDRQSFAAWEVIAGTISPLIFLALLPPKRLHSPGNEPPELDAIFPWVRSLILYVITPLSITYLGILTIYFIMILFLWELPQGLVVYLVLSFSGMALLARFLLEPFLDRHTIIRYYHRSIFYWLIPLQFVLFLSIYIRISEYGWTEKRYYVVLFGIWTLAVSIIGIIRKNKRYHFLFASIPVILIPSILGPLSSFDVSLQSQKKILIHGLQEAGVLKNGKLITSHKKSGANITGKAAGAFDYLRSREALEDLRVALEIPEKISVQDYLTDNFHFTQREVYQQRWKSFYSGNSHKPVVPINGYEYFARVSVRGGTAPGSYNYKDGRMDVDKDGTIKVYSKDGVQVASFHLLDRVRPWFINNSNNQIPEGKERIYFRSNNVRALLILESVSGRVIENNRVNLETFAFYLFWDQN